MTSILLLSPLIVLLKSANGFSSTSLYRQIHFTNHHHHDKTLLKSSSRLWSHGPNHVNGQTSYLTDTSQTINGLSKSKSAKKQPQGGDTVENFSRDMTTVLKELRASDDDPEVPSYMSRQYLSMSRMWVLDDWARHSTRARFLHYAQSLPTSRLLNRIAPQLSVFVAWTLLAVWLSPRGLFNQAVVPLTPLSLVSTFVGALLTMRSNTGLSRLKEAREIWGNVIWHTREIGQLVASKIRPKNEQLSFLLARHASIFGFLMKSHLRGKQQNVAPIVRTMLPPGDAEYVLAQRKLPAAVLMKLRQGIQQLASCGQLTVSEEMTLEKSLSKLDEALMTCDRIIASPIPPLYTSHTSRLLLFYLIFLPLALHQSSLSKFATISVSTVVGYTMLGLDEISHLLEQPFRFMPLLQLSKASMMDVGDSITCPPVPLEESLRQLGSDSVVITRGNQDSQNQEPGYWS